MKILFLSDSHYKSIFKLDLTEYDYILHAGDIKSCDIDYIKLESNVFLVRGNCDYFSNYPIEQIIELNGKKILLTHSHLYGTKDSYDELIKYATMKEVNFVIFGHTHIPTVFEKNNIIFINPGSFMEGSYMYLDGDTIFEKQKKNLFSKMDIYKTIKKIKIETKL